jgi:hypothetical protein
MELRPMPHRQDDRERDPDTHREDDASQTTHVPRRDHKNSSVKEPKGNQMCWIRELLAQSIVY